MQKHKQQQAQALVGADAAEGAAAPGTWFFLHQGLLPGGSWWLRGMQRINYLDAQLGRKRGEIPLKPSKQAKPP